MKICIIGNSHAGMLIAALQTLEEQPETVFFGKPNLEPQEFLQKGSVIAAKSKELRERLNQIGTPDTLDLGDFDVVAIVAMAPSVFSTARLVQNHCVTGWPSGQATMLKTLSYPSGPHKNRPFLSHTALREALTVLTQKSGACQLAQSLRAVCDVPIAIVPQPFPSADLLNQSDKYAVLRRINEAGDGIALAEELVNSKRSVFEKIDRLAYLVQPDRTVAHGCFSAPEFMRGAVRLSQKSKQPDHDVLHGNAKMGTIFMKQIKALRTFAAP